MSKKYRLRVGASVAVMLAAGLVGAISASAQDITEFRDGYITFTNENPALYYRVEFKPNLGDPVDWDGAYRGLRNIHSPDAEVTVPVGMFFRVVGRETPWVAGTALPSDLLSGRTAYVNDAEITGTMANIGAQNVSPGTSAQTITQGYHDGTGEVEGDTDLVAENIADGVTIFGVEGTYKGGFGKLTGFAWGESAGWINFEPEHGGVYLDLDTGELTGRAWAENVGWIKFKGVADAEEEFGVTFVKFPKGGDPAAESWEVVSDGTLETRWVVNTYANGHKTVSDTVTGSMWIQEPHALPGNSDTMNWYDATNFCNNLIYAGYSDWRLPSVNNQDGPGGPTLPAELDRVGFPVADMDSSWNKAVVLDVVFSGLSGLSWASNTRHFNTDLANIMGLNSSSATGGANKADYQGRVWPVRAGQ